MKPVPIAVRYDRGIRLPELDLWLDPPESQPRAFVSHAHSDHVARHEWMLCSDTTRLLIEARYGAGAVRQVHSLPWDVPWETNGYVLRLLPAGHILGSAMLHVTRMDDGASLLYTGDFKLRRGLSAEAAQLREANTLIMETTFGQPVYQFPPTEKVLASILAFVRDTLDDDMIPVLLGYSLGKAQEILAALQGVGVPVMVHRTMTKLTEVYEKLRQPFPPWKPFQPEEAPGHVLIFPPSAVRSQGLRQLKRIRTAMLSGWAMMPGAKYRYQVDEVFPLSDHADYPQLWECVKQVKPTLIYTVHGYTSGFTRDLRAQGYTAWSLTSEDQLELGLILSDQPQRPNLEPSQAETNVALTVSQLPPEAFARWAAACEAVAAESSRLNKQRLLADYLQTLPESELARAVRWLAGSLDDPRLSQTALHTGWATIRQSLIAATGMREAEFRRLSRSQNDAGRTAALVLQYLSKENLPTACPLLSDIAGLFAQLRRAAGVEAKAEVLRKMWPTLSPLEGSYVVRLLTGELRIGSREGLVEEAIALAFSQPVEAIREAAMLCGDMGRAAQLARQGRLAEAKPTLFVPIKVMLASPEESAEAIWQRLAAEKAQTAVWLEEKYDGIRAQLHVGKGRCEIFSRDLKPLTEAFPEMATAATELGEEVIADGEIIAYADDKKLTFHDLQRRLGRKQEADLFFSSDISVTYVMFDLLWRNGHSLLHLPLEERRRQLETLVLPPSWRRIEVRSARSPQEIEEAFHAARRAGNEGLIAKESSSAYTPGRRGKSWLKLKKAFSTLDVVVVKAEQGHGKRSHVLSDYTFAVRDEAGRLRVIGKAYSGLTDAEIEELTEHFQAHTLSQRGSVRTVIPNVVLEVAFDSIRPSRRHNSGLALRFPRIKAIRRDKTADDIDTLAYARALAGVDNAENDASS